MDNRKTLADFDTTKKYTLEEKTAIEKEVFLPINANCTKTFSALLIPIPPAGEEGESAKEYKEKVKKWLDDAQFVQSRRMNALMEFLRNEYVLRTEGIDFKDKDDLFSQEYKEKRYELEKMCTRSGKSSAFSDYENIEKFDKESFDKNPFKGVFNSKKVKDDFSNHISRYCAGQGALDYYNKNEWLLMPGAYSRIVGEYGFVCHDEVDEHGLPITYLDEKGKTVKKQYYQLQTTGFSAGLFHKYKDLEELKTKIYSDKNPEIYYTTFGGITFRIHIGRNKYRTRSKREVLLRMFLYPNIVCHAFQIRYNVNSYQLELRIPYKEIANDVYGLIEDRVLGVDLGLSTAAMLTVNYNRLIKKSLRPYREFNKEMEMRKAKDNALKSGLKYAKGGHGRKRKLRDYRIRHKSLADWRNTFNHTLAKEIVQFALMNHCKYINIEDLSFIRKKYCKDEEEAKWNKKLLANWTYYDLQQKIIEKARCVGIVVRKVNPKNTSQICSFCNEKGTRLSQDEFRCDNPECMCHRYFKKNNRYANGGFNADYNAARNIAFSEDFTEIDGVKPEKVKKVC